MQTHLMLIQLLFFWVASSLADPPAGPYATKRISYVDDGFQSGSNVSTRNMVVTFPTSQSNGNFPLVVYAHGAFAGGGVFSSYYTHFEQIASYGFIVIGPDSCDFGCAGGPTNGGWDNFQYENQRAIQFAQAHITTEVWGPYISWSSGVGIVGHSMGGTSIVLNSRPEITQKYDIRAAVIQHGDAKGTDYSAISVPTMYFQGTSDIIVLPGVTKAIYTADPNINKAYRNAKGIGHLEMMSPDVNPYIAYHTAAWLKVMLVKDSSYRDAIYGNGADSYCTYTRMKECFV